jgi:hypothetical protein
MTPSPNQVRRHLQEFGLKFGLSAQNIDKRLERLMGRQRFQDYIAVLEHSRAKGQPISDVYGLFESLEEANLVMSHQSELTLQIALWLLSQIERVARPGLTIVDLGSWTGILTRLLAVTFPDCRVIGIDRVAPVVALASAAGGTPNLQFLNWDYSSLDGKPDIRADILVSSLGIDCRPRVGMHSLDVSALRQSTVYDASLAEFTLYLVSWRAIAADGAPLHAVLRLSDTEPMLAFADAAHQSGWSVLLADSTKIVESPKSRIPALNLVARVPVELLAEDEVLSWYGWTDSPSVHYTGAQATAIYRSLGERIVTHRRSKTFDDGHTMSVEVGRAGTTAYLFARATTGYAELRLAGLLEINNLTPSFGWKQLD